VDSYKVIENIRLSEKTYRLRTNRPPTPIKAGQCFSVGTRDLAINREYSMYSAADDPFVDFLIREVEDGIVSPRLANCQIGDEVEIGGPYGEFCLKPEDVDTKDFVFLASGTGIAPFHSFVRSYPRLRYRIFHGIRFDDEQYEADHYNVDSYVPCISRPNIGSGMRVPDRLKQEDLNPQSLYYLCGNRSMIIDTVTVLREKGVPGGSIYMETFF
jgi:ferredoxin--NADP+ reductase